MIELMHRSDEIPERVALPAGIYTVEARSEVRGYVHLPVVVKPGRLTVIDLESDQAPVFAGHGRTSA